MTESEVRDLVKQVLNENAILQREHIDAIALKAIVTVLTTLGIDENDRAEFRADMVHLRKWRRSVESVERVGWGTIVTVVMTGILGALWLGFKALLGK